MEASTYITIGLGVLGFVVQGSLLAMAGVWKLTRIEAAILKDITDGRREMEAEIDSRDRKFGELLAAIRQYVADTDKATAKKINEVELFMRDTFMRRDSWHNAMNQMQERWNANERAVEERSLRLEGKIDRINERLAFMVPPPPAASPLPRG